MHYKVGEVKTVSNEPDAFGKILQQDQVQKEEPSLFNSVLNGTREEILYPQDAMFSVVIPKIGANEKIVANVDPDNEKEYLDVLLHNIAHAKGTAFPGVNGTTYLFAHSTDDFWNVGREMLFLQASKWFSFHPEISVSASLLFTMITAFFSLFGVIFQIRKLNLKLTETP